MLGKEQAAEEIRPDRYHAVAESQGEVFRVYGGGAPPYVSRSCRGNRKACNGFSNRSRNNMLEKVKRVEYATQEHVTFITLTYPPECWQGWRVSQRHLRAFIERIRRWCKARGVPMCSGFWKKEPHPQRPDVLHFHLLAFDLPYLPEAELALMWGDIIGSQRRFGAVVYVEDVGGSEGVARYVAKYVGKSNAPSSLVSGTNMHGGRWWGAWNRKAIPWAKLTRVKIPRGRWLNRVKRVARNVRVRQLSAKLGRRIRRCRGYSNGFTGFRLLIRNVDQMWSSVHMYVSQDLHDENAWWIPAKAFIWGSRGMPGAPHRRFLNREETRMRLDSRSVVSV